MAPFPKIILLATDGSPKAALAARKAIELAQTASAQLHLLYVGPPSPVPLIATDKEQVRRKVHEARKKLDAEVKWIRDAGGEVTQAHLRIGEADEKIVVLAEEIGADLIVVGSRGVSGVSRALMGSVSDSVVRHAPCPVLVVRGQADRFV